MDADESIVVLLGDLGYGLFDKLIINFTYRCINVGAAEQLMVGSAVGIALENKIPVCYSITPFLLYRPFEFIRNFLHEEKIVVKLVGSGRDKDYKDAGYTHHSTEARDILDQFHNIEKYFPENNQELQDQFQSFLYSDKPAFLSLKK
jgi:transketolase